VSPFLSLGIFAVMALFWLLPSSGVQFASTVKQG
jgi:hypothetical protein